MGPWIPGPGAKRLTHRWSAGCPAACWRSRRVAPPRRLHQRIDRSPGEPRASSARARSWATWSTSAVRGGGHDEDGSWRPPCGRFVEFGVVGGAGGYDLVSEFRGPRRGTPLLPGHPVRRPHPAGGRSAFWFATSCSRRAGSYCSTCWPASRDGEHFPDPRPLRHHPGRPAFSASLRVGRPPLPRARLSPNLHDRGPAASLSSARSDRCGWQTSRVARSACPRRCLAAPSS